jgi:TPP-dependent pyruvate/acetoin dehydrogenase alpha subunit
MGEEDYLQLEAAADLEVDAAVEFAEQSGWEPAMDLLRHVYAEASAG